MQEQNSEWQSGYASIYRAPHECRGDLSSSDLRPPTSDL